MSLFAWRDRWNIFKDKPFWKRCYHAIQRWRWERRMLLQPSIKVPGSLSEINRRNHEIDWNALTLHRYEK